MRRLTCVIALVLVATFAAYGDHAVQAQQQKVYSVADLGPEPLYGAPRSLATLVSQVPAVVIAEVGAPGQLRFEEFPVPHSTKRTVFGYATYQVTIRDVVFNKAPANAPALTVGSTIQLLQRVGRERAEAFVAGDIPVKNGDECLLFLWLQPHGWAMLNWELQFRKSQKIPTTAEGVWKPEELGHSNREWLGSSVPYAKNADDLVLPDWNSLVGEIRRLAMQPPPKA